MKVLNFFTSNSYYRFNLATLKVIGFAFFSVKFSDGKIKFHISLLNCAVFILSTAFSFMVLVVEGKRGVSLQANSPILSVAMVLLFRMSMINIVATKIVYFVGHRAVFNSIRCFINIDKKVFIDFLVFFLMKIETPKTVKFKKFIYFNFYISI